LCQYSLVGNTI